MKLTEEEVEKDLGVWISSDMKCSQKCIQTFNKASRVMGMIKRTIRYNEVRIMIIYGRPMEYGDHIYFHAVVCSFFFFFFLA